jgi:hypothetical protein
MNAADRFLRFAAECEVMAKFSRSPQIWREQRFLLLAHSLHLEQRRICLRLGSNGQRADIANR